jgi:hypothetical protein
MFTYAQLAALQHDLADKRVLTVYLEGSVADPAMQRSWRVQLDHCLSDLRRWLEDSSHAEREEFERCVQRLAVEIADVGTGVGAPGWAAFITADRVHDVQRLPAPTPTLAVWSTGPCIAPYVRALKEHRPVVVALVDARQASIYKYRLGTLEHVDVIRAHHGIDAPQHMGTPPRQGFHSGTRGRAGHDAAQRSLLRGRERMIAEAAERILQVAGKEGWILVGGIKRVAAMVVQLLEPASPGRVAHVESLDVHATAAEITQVARSGASALRDKLDEWRIAELLDLAGAHGLAVIGPADARLALRQSSVRDLFITRRYLEEHAAEADEAIRAALDQDALVEEVSGRAAERLNEHGGMAAGLRFRAASAELLAAER